MPSYFAPDAENTASLYYMNAFCGEAESRNIHAIRRNEVQNRPFMSDEAWILAHMRKTCIFARQRNGDNPTNTI